MAPVWWAVLAAAVVALATKGAALDVSVTAEGEDIHFEASEVFVGVDKVALLSHMNDVLQKLEELGGKVTALEGENTALRGRVTELEGDRDDLETRLAALEAQTLDARVTSLKNRVDAMEGHDLNTRVEEIESQDLESRIGTLEQAGLIQRLKTMEDVTVPGVSSRITALETSNIASRVSALESEDCDARLDTLESKNLDSRINTLEGKNLDSRINTLEGKNLDTRITALESNPSGVSTADFNALKTKTAPIIVYSTGTAGTYDLRTIFDDALRTGLLGPHFYDCLLRTSNGAHWKGVKFSIVANYYRKDTHSGYPHIISDVVNLDAGSSGCSNGLTSFSVTSSTGSFSFNPGNCQQTITLACRAPYY